VDSLARGETITGVLTRSGLSSAEAAAVVGAATGFDARRAPAGMRVTLGGFADSAMTQIVFHLGLDRLLRLTRTDSGWVSAEERLAWRVDTVVVRGEIESSLSAAFESSATGFPARARAELAWDVADVFEYRLDMSRDLQPGDRFAVVVERRRLDAVTRFGRIFAADYEGDGTRIRAVRFDSGSGRPRFFEHDGKSMEALFLRAPLEFRRISSSFGMRRHPILGIWRRHQGTDYAAASGTPVRAIGDGVVIRAGRVSGFGNVVDVRHVNGYVSRYGHLRGFAADVRGGRRVTIGQTIGYVGMTGLATAPHLHFEVLVGGQPRNPRTALSVTSAQPLAAGDRPAFEAARDHFLAMLDTARLREPPQNP
jgi:murein DD-endopeptidase MepM/ murein hydrolase activator NlpD